MTSSVSKTNLILILLTVNIITVVYCNLLVTSLENIEAETPWNPQFKSDPSSPLSHKSSAKSLANHMPGVGHLNHAFYGEYAYIRSQLDYNYHSYYDAERQLLQDSIIHFMINSTIVVDESSDAKFQNSTTSHCSVPAFNPWIVFTAGAMGAGKTHTIRHLHQHKLFPLDAFVTVDPDEIRRLLPEYETYIQQSPSLAGELTRKEAGYIAEILTIAALDEGKNVLVDGSLRDHEWYRKYFEHLRLRYPNFNLAILHITASREAVLERARKRGLETGRIVPKKTLESALEQVPISVKFLSPLVDFFCELYNGSESSQSSNSDKKRSDSGKSVNKYVPTNKIRITTPDIDWESFQMKWKQYCAISTNIKKQDSHLKEISSDHGNEINRRVNAELNRIPGSREERSPIVIRDMDDFEGNRLQSKL